MLQITGRQVHRCVDNMDDSTMGFSGHPVHGVTCKLGLPIMLRYEHHYKDHHRQLHVHTDPCTLGGLCHKVKQTSKAQLLSFVTHYW